MALQAVLLGQDTFRISSYYLNSNQFICNLKSVAVLHLNKYVQCSESHISNQNREPQKVLLYFPLLIALCKTQTEQTLHRTISSTQWASPSSLCCKMQPALHPAKVEIGLVGEIPSFLGLALGGGLNGDGRGSARLNTWSVHMICTSRV